MISTKSLTLRRYPEDYSIRFVSTLNNLQSLMKDKTCYNDPRRDHKQAFEYYINLAHDIQECIPEHRSDVEAFWYGLHPDFVVSVNEIRYPILFVELFKRYNIEFDSHNEPTTNTLFELSLSMECLCMLRPPVSVFMSVITTITSNAARHSQHAVTAILRHLISKTLYPHLCTYYPSDVQHWIQNNTSDISDEWLPYVHARWSTES